MELFIQSCLPWVSKFGYHTASKGVGPLSVIFKNKDSICHVNRKLPSLEVIQTLETSLDLPETSGFMLHMKERAYTTVKAPN